MSEETEMLERAIFIPKRLGDVVVSYDDSDFIVGNTSTGKLSPIQRCFMDKKLRGISRDKLKKLVAAGLYLSLNKMDGCDEYSLKLNGRLNGGGLWGASIGFWGGKSAVHIGAQGAIGAVSGLTTLCLGPIAGTAVYAGLTKATFIPVEYASNVVGAGCGIALATATGPV